MRKVVYNACFGGFSLSTAAVRRAREITGDSNWAGIELPDASGKSLFGDSHRPDDSLPRHDPVLVRVVEDLGAQASGLCAKLRVAEVEGPYRIDEYDGLETVATPDSYSWVE